MSNKKRRVCSGGSGGEHGHAERAVSSSPQKPATRSGSPDLSLAEERLRSQMLPEFVGE